MTGTAVNPLFRAAYLAKEGEMDVTLVIPWLSLKEQALVYPNSVTFESPAQQETYVRQWLEESTKLKSNFRIQFYPAKVLTVVSAYVSLLLVNMRWQCKYKN